MGPNFFFSVSASPRTLALAIALIGCSCGSSDGDSNPDATPPLPGVAGYLSPSSYDCSATGPFEPPARPAALGCFADDSCDTPLVTGHRMANPFAPENTLSAARAAILLGVDIIETDIRLSSDGQVVLVHDGDVNRTTDGVGNVGDLTLAELRALKIEPETDDPPGDFSCERIPTLDELFAITRDKVVVELEVKDSAAGAVAAAYVRDNNLYGQAFLLCSNSECEAARAAVADVPIMTRPKAPDEVAGALAFTPGPILVHIDPTRTFLTDQVVGQIHAAGAKVYANGFVFGDGAALGSGDLSQYLQLFEDGLDVIQSEYPHYALQALGRLQPTM
jgi:glycerophosphoryl diester phosphodiesterase